MGRFEDKIQDIENSILLTLEEAADILESGTITWGRSSTVIMYVPDNSE